MKSSIFSDNKPRTKSKRPAQVHSTIPTKRHATPTTSTPKILWNLDELILAYTDLGELPPILSPTLPKRDGDDLGEFPLLSPTLPPIFAAKSSKPSTPKESSPVAQPQPKYSVKWINKMDGPKPRFFVRISVEPSYYQTKIRSPVKGLGIVVDEKRSNWVTLAKTAKSQCLEKNGDVVKALVTGVDSVLMSLTACDQEERAKGVRLEPSWRLLDGDMKAIIARLTRGHPNQPSLAELIHVFTLFLWQCRALVQLRIVSLLRQSKGLDSEQMAWTAMDTATECFAQAKPAFINSVVPNRLPQTFRQRLVNLEKVHAEYLMDNSAHNLRPAKKSFYLPIGSYLTLAEVAGLLYAATNEFIAIYNKNLTKALDYSLKA